MTRLNVVGADLARNEAVHGMTDVTGFGLLGHALEMARGAGLTLRLRVDDAPLLAQAESSPAPASSPAPRTETGQATASPLCSLTGSRTGAACC